MMGAGAVWWLTGLSGAGKTTVATLLVEELKLKGKSVILLDGDELRQLFAMGDDYSVAARHQLAHCYARLSQMLAKQNYLVICATISMFSSVRRWNREHIENYREIYLKVPAETLHKRDSKFLYGEAGRTDVVGVDLPWDEPTASDLVIDNHGECTPQWAVEKILGHLL